MRREGFLTWIRRIDDLKPSDITSWEWDTYRKDLVHGDFMFDDAPRNLERCRATRIMMDYLYNRDFTDCYRVSDWAEFEALMADLIDGRERGLR